MAGVNELTEAEMNRLVEEWILTFLETPVLLDPELMRRVLARTRQEQKHRTDVRNGVQAGRPGQISAQRRQHRTFRRDWEERSRTGAQIVRSVRNLTFRGDRRCEP